MAVDPTGRYTLAGKGLGKNQGSITLPFVGSEVSIDQWHVRGQKCLNILILTVWES